MYNKNCENITRTHPSDLFGHSGVVDSDESCYIYITLLTITISITYKNLYSSKYTKYKQYLFDIIKGYKECFVTPI